MSNPTRRPAERSIGERRAPARYAYRSLARQWPGSPSILDACADRRLLANGGTIYLSAVTAWEIALLVDTGRIVLDVPIEDCGLHGSSSARESIQHPSAIMQHGAAIDYIISSIAILAIDF
jgi:hypothetical protein